MSAFLYAATRTPAVSTTLGRRLVNPRMPKEWTISLVNQKGGAIALGHPLGASVGRILGTLSAVLRERKERYGVAAICIGLGQALAVVLENLEAGA